jgi:retron-type reverse transcriptase
MEPEQSGRINGSLPGANPNGDEHAVAVKPFDIPKRLVLQAWRLVRANRGAPGVDEESLELFERDLKKNLYRIWNRMSSGSYFPAPVKEVLIPKKFTTFGESVSPLRIRSLDDKALSSLTVLPVR